MSENTFIRKVGSLRGGTRDVVRLRARNGFTLLEILTSIFVLTFGLLGITAMMQIGGYRVWQATRRDKAAYLAEQAFSDIQIRGTIPALTRHCDGTPFANRCLAVYDPEGQAKEGRFGRGMGENDVPVVPSYFANWVNNVWEDVWGDASFFDPMRVRPTQSRDDLVWNSDNADRRPVAQWWLQDGSMVPKVDAYGNRVEKALTQAYEGNWSWMATIQPVGGRWNNRDKTFGYDTRTYEVSVAVYESRTFGSEWCYEVVEPGIDGLMSKTLRLPKDGVLYQGASDRALLQPGHWVALVGIPLDAFAGDRDPYEIQTDRRIVWMQVVRSVVDGENVIVGLTGPDLVGLETVQVDGEWKTEYRPLLISSNYPIWLITDPEIVGVVTRTMTVAE